MTRKRKGHIEIRFVIDGFYVAGTHNKPIKIKIPKEVLEGKE